jgi:hypothetical protein
MKKAYLFIVISLMSTMLSAQQPYNGSFEHWYSPTNPDGWGTWSSAVAQYNTALSDSMIRFAAKDSLYTPGIYTDDTSSVRIAVDTITLPSQGQVTLAGFVALGGAFYVAPPDTAPGLYYGFYPYTKAPDSIIIDYKYVTAAGHTDTALLAMTMQRFDSTSQVEIYYIDTSWLLMPSSGWVHLAIPLRGLYSDTLTQAPDSIQIIILSSLADTPRIGTILWVDSVHFDASVNIIDTSTVGIANIQNIKGINIYPNPADALVHVLVEQSEIGSSVTLYDAGGQKVYEGKINNTDYTIPTQCLAEGVYTIRVNSTDRLTIYSGHVAVVHSQ